MQKVERFATFDFFRTPQYIIKKNDFKSNK
jgi:hypothetical protein